MTKKKPATPAPAEIPPNETPGPPSPDESPAPEPMPATVDEAIQLAPAQTPPDAAAALAALDGPPAPAPGTSPPAVPNAELAKEPKRWTDRRISRASRKELKARVVELQASPLAAAPAPGAIAPVPVTTEEVETLIGQVLPAVDACLVFFGGKELATTPEQRKLLAKTYTAPAIPHYETLKARLPWLPAIGATLGVYVPKVIDRLQAAAKLKRAAAAELGTPAPDVAPVVIEPVPLEPGPPAPVGMALVPDYPMPFGGPIE